jgi:uncharacterized protein YijF (DUF1287 family)
LAGFGTCLDVIWRAKRSSELKLVRPAMKRVCGARAFDSYCRQLRTVRPGRNGPLTAAKVDKVQTAIRGAR